MKTWRFVVAAAAVLAMVGCRTDPRITMLERQNRLLEDEIYRLRWALEDCGGGVASIDGPTLAMPGQFNSAAAPGPVGSTAPRTFGGAAPGPAAGPLQIDLGEPVPQDEGLKLLQPKSSEDSPEPAPDTTRPAPTPTPPKRFNEAPRFEPNGTGRLAPPADSGRVELITLHETLCGGYDGDGRPGDEGIRVVLEPRNTHGRILAAPAAVAVVVLDPALEGEAARVGRWDFPADEIARRFRNDGILLEALWPAPPQHNDLHLFVRYTTRDGRHIETDRPIRVALPGKSSRRWAPTEPRPTPARRPPPPPEPEPELQAEGPASPGNSVTPQIRFPHKSPTAATRPTPATRRPDWSPYRDR